MKKIILAVFVVLVSTGSNAQEKSDFEKDTYVLIEMITKPTMTPLISQITAGMVPSEKQADFIKEVEASLPELYTIMGKIYMEEFSHKDIKGMIKFYESPLGQKIISTLVSVSKKSMEAGQSWAMKLISIADKYKIKYPEASSLDTLEQK